MKKIMTLFLTILLGCFVLSGCTKDEILNHYNNAIQAIGSIELTNSLVLKGKKEKGVDDYTGTYQAAGSKNVYEIHGSIHRNYCQKCGKFYDAAYVKNSKGVPHCECGGVIKPDVVLYEESLDENMIDKSIRAISQADTLIIGGTSLVVYPAAGFVDYFRGKHLVVINKSDTAKSVRAELTIAAPIGEVLSQITV